MNFRDKIQNLFDKLTGNQHETEEIGVINSKLSAQILEQAKMNLDGYVITIDNYGIQHALNRHGDESQPNQISLSEEDFFKLQRILEEADEIKDVSRKNKIAIQFQKNIDNEYFTIFDVITITGKKKKLHKKNRISFKTMFIRKSSNKNGS